MRRLFIDRRLLDEVVGHCRGALPDEACGILAGRADKAERVYKVENSEKTPFTYMLDPKEQLNAMREIERDGLSVLAIYHSHPGSAAYPSGVDIERAFFPGTSDLNFPGVAHVIVAVTPEASTVRAFMITKLRETVEVEISSSDNRLRETCP